MQRTPGDEAKTARPQAVYISSTNKKEPGKTTKAKTGKAGQRGKKKGHERGELKAKDD